MAKPLKFGIIGAGNIGNVHINTLKKFDNVEVTAITDAFVDAAKATAEKHGIGTVCNSAEALLQEDVDVVVIAVPNKYHAPLAVEAMKADKHIILEKPMALNVEGAKEIVKAQEATGKVVLVPHQMRWDNSSRAVKEKIDLGGLGQVYYAKSGWFRRKGIPGWGTWFTQKEESGGGPLIDIGVHMLDLSMYLMGQPKPVSVYGATYAEFGPRKKGIGGWGTPNWNGFYDVEDLAAAMIKMEDGTMLSLEVSWAVNGNIEGGGSFVHLMGTDGGAALSGKQATYYTEQDNETVDETLAPSSEGDARQLMYEHYIACLNEGRQPISNAMTGLANNLILDAIYRSSQTGSEIKLDWSL